MEQRLTVWNGKCSECQGYGEWSARRRACQEKIYRAEEDRYPLWPSSCQYVAKWLCEGCEDSGKCRYCQCINGAGTSYSECVICIKQAYKEKRESMYKYTQRMGTKVGRTAQNGESSNRKRGTDDHQVQRPRRKDQNKGKRTQPNYDKI